MRERAELAAALAIQLSKSLEDAKRSTARLVQKGNGQHKRLNAPTIVAMGPITAPYKPISIAIGSSSTKSRESLGSSSLSSATGDSTIEGAV